MPFRRQPVAAPPPQAAPQGMGIPTLFPKSMQPSVRTIGGILGWGTRVGSGILGAEGGPIGAGISGAGEGLAEMLEGSLDKEHTAKRIGAEAALGLIPFGSFAKTGRAVTSIGKTGLLGGVGDVGRQWAEGNFDAPETKLSDLVTGNKPKAPGWNIGRTALATLLGAISGGVVNHMDSRVPAAKPEPVVIESSGAVPKDVARTGLDVKPPKTDATNPRNFTDKANWGNIEPGTTAHSAGRAMPASPNYSSGVDNINPLPATKSTPIPTTSPARAAGRLSYAAVPAAADEVAEAPIGPSVEDEMTDMLNKFPTRPLTGVGKDLEEVLGNLDENRTRMGNRVEAVRTQTAKEAKETAKRELIQRRRIAAGVEPSTSFSSTVSSETPTGVRESMTTKFRPPQADDAEGGTEALKSLLTAAPTPEAAQAIEKAAKGASGRTTELLQNLDEEGMKYFTYLRNIMGDSDGGAYRKAIYEQQVRQARAAKPVAQVRPDAEVAPVAPGVVPPTPPVTPKSPINELKQMLGPTPKEVLEQTVHPSFTDNGVEGLENAPDIAQRQQTTHPSFYDEGFDGLADASKNGRKAPPNGKPPAGAAAKLDSHLSMADPDTAAKLREASAIYNNPESSKEARKAAGKQLFQLGKMLDPKGNKGAATIEAQLSLAFGAAGGLAGAAADASSGDDPSWDGALTGAMVGAGIPHLPKALSAIRAKVNPANEEQVTSAAKAFVNKLPQVERFGMLLNPQGVAQRAGEHSGIDLAPDAIYGHGAQGVPTPIPALAMNAIAGPYGSVLTHAVKSILQDDPRGWKLLKAAWNPLKFGKGWWDSSDEAWQALVHGEEGRASNLGSINPHSAKDKLLAYPGQLMTMGDTYARKLLTEAGFAPEEARQATLTNEPGEAWRALSNVAKRNPLMQMMFPFRRTPVNILEQGFETTPGLAQIGQMFGLTKSKGGLEQVVDQGLGGLAGVGDYALAANIQDDQSRKNVRRLISNAAGRYSLPAQIGYMIGDARARHLKGINSVVNEQNAEQLFPLPSVEVPVDMLKKGANVATGNVHSPWDALPESLTMKPLRQFLGDALPGARHALGVQGKGFRRRSFSRQRPTSR